MAKKVTSTQIIQEMAKKLGYSTKYLSSTGIPKRLLISNGEKICIVNSSKFGFYPEMKRWHQHLFDSKLLTQQLLKDFGYKTIATIPVENKQYSSFTALYSDIVGKVKKYPVIVKPDGGLGGKDIGIAETKIMLRTHLEALYKKKKKSLVQPILDHDEYRILIINNKVEVIHMKKLQGVYGDGVKTLKELLAVRGDREIDKTFVQQQLKKKKLTLKSILPKGEKFHYHITRFIAPGEYYESECIPSVVSTWANQLATNLSAPTIGIDIFAPNGLLDPSKYIIIELNANPAFDYFKTKYNDPTAVERVVKNALEHYFTATS